MYKYRKKMSQAEFAKLIQDSPEFQEYVFQTLYIAQKSTKKVVPLINGQYALTVYIPERLTYLVDNPPDIDLEMEPLEKSA